MPITADWYSTFFWGQTGFNGSYIYIYIYHTYGETMLEKLAAGGGSKV